MSEWIVKRDANFCGSESFPYLVMMASRGPCDPNVIASRMSLENAERVASIPALAAENAKLRKIIATADGNSASSFDWSVLAEIDDLEEANAKLRERVAVAEGERDKVLAAFTELRMVSLPPHDISGTAMFDTATETVADVRREIHARTALADKEPA